MVIIVTGSEILVSCDKSNSVENISSNFNESFTKVYLVCVAVISRVTCSKCSFPFVDPINTYVSASIIISPLIGILLPVQLCVSQSYRLSAGDQIEK